MDNTQLKKQQDSLFQVETMPVASKKRKARVACAISPSNMEAIVKVVTTGTEFNVGELDILSEIYAKGVRIGVRYDVIAGIVAKKFANKGVVVANGFLPEDGKDAAIEPVAELKEFDGPDAKGVPVELDQQLAVKTPATPGVAGRTVLGRRLDPNPGRDVDFEFGENVAVSDDGLSLIAAIPGLAGFSDGLPAIREDKRDEWKFKVKLRKNNMEAVLIISPSSGERPEINDEYINRILTSNNVGFGVEPALAASIPPNIATTTVIKAAVGKPPVAGRDAVVIERFRDKAEKGQRLFEVKKDQLIVEKTPGRPGVEGRNVLNEALAPQEGKDSAINTGAGARISPDRLKLFADTDGYISRIKDAYHVVECKELDSTKGAIPQRINYAGMIRILGDVSSGHLVIAGHHVVIHGNVNDSEIVAGGSLQVHGDIIDCAKTKIQAGGDMFLRSADRAKLRAGGNIYFSGTAQNCEIVAVGGIYNTEKDSFSLVGGRIVASKNIEVDEIGAPPEARKVTTTIEAGVPFQMRVRYEYAVQEVAGLKRKQAVISKEFSRLLGLARAKKISRVDFEKMNKLKLYYKMVSEKVRQKDAYLNKLVPVIKNFSSDSIVTARKSAYPGTLLKIGIHSYHIKDPTDGAFFKINEDNTGVETRKLKSDVKKEVTIMFTDIVAYSSYTSKYGDAMANKMLSRHNELLFPIVTEFNGRIIKTIGDSIMAVYEKPDNALHSAIKMQNVLQAHNVNEPPEHQIKIRIGMNTGVGIIEDNDVFGDVVNMAARVEGLTDGDEIRISVMTYEAIEDKTDLELCSMGMKKLKGKEEMVEIFDVMWEE